MNLDEFSKKYDVRIDVLDEVTRVQVGECEGEEFYKDLVETVRNYSGKISIANGVVGSVSKEDFLRGEEIIQGVIEEINPDWTKKQKAAAVHYRIGKLVSYIADFNFRGKFINSTVATDARNIWKSLVNQQSVCNGITSIARNILSRIGIKTEELSSGTHSFLLVETEEGNIITDPTWDLKNSLYGARPNYFGRTYEQLRADEEGLSNAHKLENPPENVIEITEKELREIYHSLGYTKEDRTFIFPILDKVQGINEKEYNSMDEKLDTFFAMFAENFSDEATHLSETRGILESCMYELGIEPRNLATKFVYSKDDEDCQKPFLTLCINSEQTKSRIVLLDADEVQFKGMDINEFDKQYKAHDLDPVEPFWKKHLPEVEKEHDKDTVQL